MFSKLSVESDPCLPLILTGTEEAERVQRRARVVQIDGARAPTGSGSDGSSSSQLEGSSPSQNSESNTTPYTGKLYYSVYEKKQDLRKEDFFKIY